MNKLSSFLLAASVLVASVANATVIDFEDLTGGNVLASNYAGLTWGVGWNYYDFAQSPYTAASGKQRVYNYDANGDWFKFNNGVKFVGAYFSGNDNAQFELYNLGSLVHTSSSISLSGVPTFLNSGYAGLIDEVRINGNNGYFVMDDVTYNVTSSVSEPASLAFLGFGLVAMASIRRKKSVIVN